MDKQLNLMMRLRVSKMMVKSKKFEINSQEPILIIMKRKRKKKRKK
jgi:hypothetical protein